MIEINFFWLVNLCKLAIPGMSSASSARCVHITSEEGFNIPRGGDAPYSVVKGAANRLLGHLSSEFEGTALTIHAVLPGAIKSNMWLKIRDASEGVPGLERLRHWAKITGDRPDDPRKVGELIGKLIGNEFANKAHGKFIWAQEPERMEALG
mgnify:FL=1